LPLPGLRVGAEEIVDVEVVARELVVVPDVEDNEEVADEPDTLEELVEMAGLREELKGVAEEELVELDFVDEINRTEAELGNGEVL
jgi:hypothetical protein